MDENYNTIFMVSLPAYKEGFLSDNIIDDMKEDGYFDSFYEENGGRCFFRVTEAEYNDITEHFFDECRRAGKKSEDFVFKPKLD